MSKRASLSWWSWLALLALTEWATAQTTITVDPATRRPGLLPVLAVSRWRGP